MKRQFIYVLALMFAVFTMVSAVSYAQETDSCAVNEYKILTPKPGPEPRINGPLVYGCHPGNPFLYRIPCQGERPILFSVKDLPSGLKLDANTGIITGTSPEKGEYKIVILAGNSKGKDKRELTIVAGDKLALTPPMGWNHWYAYYNRITDKLIREAADRMVSSGMTDVGYQYINIDDCWMNAEETGKYMPDPTRVGPTRDENGNIIPNRYFPDMKSLTNYIHDKGLKAGIYTSPGRKTCCWLAGSWGHEEQDAAQFAEWGFDFLKYDWCTYSRIVGKKPSLVQMKEPFILMGDALKKQKRDIVYNLCQYGMGDVWEWGAKVGGNCWRTAGDLGFELDRFFDVALKNASHGKWSKPGEWNDPDYLQIGWFGSQIDSTFTQPKPCPLPPDMQYSYMSLWCLMAAPLVYSGDMTRLDDFTLNILCNTEVIGVDQDPLGECALVIKLSDKQFIMVKNLVDGSRAVGLFNREEDETEISVDWKTLQLSGKQFVRDLWRQKDLGAFKDKFSARVPSQGVVMVKIGKKK